MILALANCFEPTRHLILKFLTDTRSVQYADQDFERAKAQTAKSPAFGAGLSKNITTLLRNYFSYRPTLQAMIDAVIATEAPLRTDILCQRIARAHGWLRTGGRIKERIEMHLKSCERTFESSGEFVWGAGTVVNLLPYRSPASEEARRPVSDIPLAELANVVVAHKDLLEEPDPTRELARWLGLERLTAPSRVRLDDAILRARTHLTAILPD